MPRRITATAGQPVTIPAVTLPGIFELPNRDPQTGTEATVTYDNPGLRTVKFTATETIELDVQASTPVAPVHPGGHDVEVKPSERINDVLKRAGSGTASKPRVYGIQPGTYSGSIDIISHVRLTALGAVIVKGSFRADRDRNFSVKGITFDGTGRDATGIDLRRSEDAEFDGVRVMGFGGMGVTVLGIDAAALCRNIRFRNFLIADSYPLGEGHVSGIYAQHTDGLSLENFVLDRNGGQGNAATKFNHNAYINSTVRNFSANNGVIARASNYGAQFRAGGQLSNLVFIDNPSHCSIGYVNGSPVYPGGVTASLNHAVFIGTQKLEGDTKGWCMDIGNAKDVKVNDILIAHNTASGIIDPAIVVKRCFDVRGGTVEIPSSQQRVTLGNVYKWNWNKGTISARDGIPVQQLTNFGIVPPKQATRDEMLGANVFDFIRANPVTAAQTLLERCYRAAGI